MFKDPVTHDNMPKAVEYLLQEISRLRADLSKEREPGIRRIPGREARQILLEKGYKVKSDAAFINLIKALEIPKVRAGANELWYDQDAILSLPKRVKR